MSLINTEYEPPCLVLLGRLSELTQSGGGLAGDMLDAGDLLSFLL